LISIDVGRKHLLLCEQIVNRKGRVEERMPVLVLFSADVMSCIFKAADAASVKSLDERHYHFLKRLTLVSV
jgi:exportin-5